jgi:putative DNA primase/helicase
MTDKQLESVENALRKRLPALQSRSRVMDVLTFARGGPGGLGTPGDAWDSEPMLLAVKNGVIELTNGRCRAGLPGDMIKTVCPTEWRGLDEPCSLWEKAIRDIFPQDVIDYVQKVMGYSITGRITHHFLVICHGAGSNGKSLFFETLGSVLGDYAFQIPSETLLASSRDSGGGQSRSDIMALRGRRLCYTQEINSRRSLDLAKSKLLTGNDTVSARELYGKQTTFKPTWKIFMITNSRPNADANDFGIWRRLVLLPFERQFVEKPAAENERLIDYELPEKLKAEYPGILAWAVRGCLKWQAEGLQPPERVKMATADYRTENDTIQQFITDACIVAPGIRCRPTELYQWYQKFCTDDGLDAESQTAFSKQMKARFKTERTPSARWFIGITTKSEPES